MTLSSEATRSAIKRNNADAAAGKIQHALEEVFGVPYAIEFSPLLVQRIADWQRGAGLAADGLVGPLTRAKLTKQEYLAGIPSKALWPDGGDEYTHYVRLALPPGMPPPPRPVVMLFRGVYPFARRTHRMIHAARYDDTAVLIQPGVAPHVFACATHAYQLDSGESPDENGDKRGDVGSIRPGWYVMSALVSDPPMFQLRTLAGKDEIPCFRDDDHDGVISEREAERSISVTKGKQVKPGVGMYATSVLFHPGFDARKPGTGAAFSSIACLTASEQEIRRLRAAGKLLDLRLVDASAVVPREAPPTVAPPKAIA